MVDLIKKVRFVIVFLMQITVTNNSINIFNTPFLLKQGNYLGWSPAYFRTWPYALGVCHPACSTQSGSS